MRAGLLYGLRNYRRVAGSVVGVAGIDCGQRMRADAESAVSQYRLPTDVNRYRAEHGRSVFEGDVPCGYAIEGCADCKGYVGGEMQRVAPALIGLASVLKAVTVPICAMVSVVDAELLAPLCIPAVGRRDAVAPGRQRACGEGTGAARERLGT